MGQRIDSGIGSDPRGQAQGQLEVHQCGHGHEACPDAEHLLVAFLVGDDGETSHFRTGAGSGWNGNDRQTGLGDVARELVVAHFATMLGEDADGLSAINRATATQCDDAVIATTPSGFDTCLD
ncbi:hypothetical protein D9M68_666520 [compost metagenome]